MSEPIQNPINAFPEYIQQIICHYSEAKGYPIEYFIQSFLGAASTAMGRSVTLKAGAYTSIANIWCIILGKKGYTKSEPLEDAFKPILDYEYSLYVTYKNECDELEEYRANNPKVKVADVKKPPQILANDTTPERLIMILAENQKGVGIFYDEIAGFVGRFNRYANGGDEQMFLSLFNGSSVKRDRMTAESTVFAKKTFLTIIGTTQPKTLKDVFFDKTESGFFDRWLITQPDGFTKQYPNQFGINPVEEAKYKTIIHRLMGIQYDEHNAFQMTYSPTSNAICLEYQKYLVDEQNKTDNDDYRGMLAKMEIYLHKFALILQCLEFAVSNDTNDFVTVSDASAKGAVILTKYFIDQAQKVRLNSPVDLLKNEWPEIYNQMPSPGITFSRNQFVEKCAQFSLSERTADKFLKEHSERSEKTLFYKVKQGQYTKNMF